MASGDTLIELFPYGAEGPASNYGVADLRNNHPILAYNDTTGWANYFTAILPRCYAGGGITVYVHWAAVATSGTVGWLIALERDNDAGQDIDSDGFAADQTITAATVDGTSGNLKTTNVAISNGANMDSVAAGEQFRLRVTRDVANDSAVGDAQITSIEIKET